MAPQRGIGEGAAASLSRRAFGRGLATLGALALPGAPAALAQTPRLSLTTGALPPITASPAHPGFIAELARIAFGRVGVEVDVTAVPTERSLINVNAGIDDGDIFRVAGVEQEYPNLIRIPEKTLDNDFVGFTLRSDVAVRSWADLRPYSVAFATGWKPFERNVTDVRDLTRTPSIHELVPLLENGRADIVLMDRWQGQWEVNRSQRRQVRVLEPPLASFEMFMYLHRRHADLVPRVTRSVAEMKADGTWQRLYDTLLKSLTQA